MADAKDSENTEAKKEAVDESVNDDQEQITRNLTRAEDPLATKTEDFEGQLAESVNPEADDLESQDINKTDSESEDESDGSSVTDDEETDEDQDLSDDVGEEVLRLEPWANERRHSGDGEEQPDKTLENKLDDDEDKMNPAYIPRKGSFFEHDLRLDDGDDVEADAKLTKKKLWYDRVKWQHDKFDERSQAPKSREEIVAIYGFDIRADGDLPYDSSRKSRKRNNKKGKGKKLGDYIYMPKPTTAGFLTKEQMANRRQIFPRRSWPENTLRKKNVITKRVSPEMVITSGSNRYEGMPDMNDRSFPHEERKAEIAFLNGGQESFGRRSTQDDPRYNLVEERNQAPFGPVDRKLPSRCVRSSKNVRIGTGRVVGKTCQGNFQQDKSASKQSSDNSRRQSKKHFATRGSRSVEFGYRDPNGIHGNVRTIHNSNVGKTLQEVTAEADDQMAPKIVSSAVTKSQDVRLLETKDSHGAVSRINNSAIREGSGRDRGFSKSGGRKSTVIIQTTMAPEIIPPVTRIPTYTKSVETRSIRGQPPQVHDTLPGDTTSESHSTDGDGGVSYGWTGGEFIPSERILSKSDASGRPKRYSSQRQKVPADSGLSESADGGGALTSVVVSASLTTSLSARPCPTAAYYGPVSAAQTVPTFPQTALLPLGISTISYSVPVSSNLPSGHIRVFNGPPLRGSPVAMGTAPPPPAPLIHAPYLNPPPAMLQGPYIAPPVISYGGPLAPQYAPMATGSISVQFAAGTTSPVRNQRPDGNPLEVRGGTVYFNPEMQQVDVHHGTMYFSPDQQANAVRSPVKRPKAAIPIVKPEDATSSADVEAVAVLPDKEKLEEPVEAPVESSVGPPVNDDKSCDDEEKALHDDLHLADLSISAADHVESAENSAAEKKEPDDCV